MSGKLQKELTKPIAKRKAYKAFQLYLRALWTKSGLCNCYTCDKPKSYKEIQVGHWVEGHSNASYINEYYVRPQCFYCNIQLGGNQGEFRDRMRKELGNERVDELLRESKKTLDIKVSEYLGLESFYKMKLQGLQNS